MNLTQQSMIGRGEWRTARGNWNFTDDAGGTSATSPFTVFSVTGDVYAQAFGLCQVTVASVGGAATIELGIGGNTAALIAQTAADDLDQYETWQDAGPEANPGAVPLDARGFVIANGADVIMTIGAANLTAGDVDFVARWFPISDDGDVTAT